MDITLLADRNISREIEQNIKSLGLETVYAPRAPGISDATAWHPDMNAFPIDGALVVNRECVGFYTARLGNKMKITASESFIRSPYPGDVALNCVRFGKHLFCHAAGVDAEVLKAAAKAGIEIIGVRQGYTGCSVLKLNDNAAITEDTGLAAALNGAGVRVLLVKKGGVALSGYPYGFIGGAAFTYGRSVYFYGDISKHENYREIKDFCRSNGVSAEPLSAEPLGDFGKGLILP